MNDQDSLREAIEYLKRGEGSFDNPAIFGMHLARLGQHLAAAAESTLPRTRMVEVWHVSGAVVSGISPFGAYRPFVTTFATRAEADEYVTDLGYPKHRGAHHCIRVTGPHLQEVPA